MTLRNKLIFSFSLLTLLVFMRGTVNLVTAHVTNQAFDEMLISDTPALLALGQIEAASNEMRETVVHHLFLHSIDEPSAEVEEFNLAKVAFETAIEQFRATTDDKEDAQEIAETGAWVIEAGQAALDSLENEPDNQAYLHLLDNIEVAEQSLQDLLDGAVLEQNTELEQEAASARILAARATFADAASMVAALFIASGLGIFLTRSTVVPLSRLQKSVERFMKGDYTHRAAIVTKDEIGELTAVFNSMAEAVEVRDTKALELNHQLEARVQETQVALARAEKSDQVKSAFLASMSHELRTPLNSVINFTKFVLKGVMGPVTERQTEALSKVVASGKHLLDLINDVLDISKIESGTLTLFVENNVNVSEILYSAASTAEGLVGDKPVKMGLEIDADLPLITGDRQRILQIVLNLVSNACKFTQEGSITISARRKNDELEIAVKDTGPGIAPEDYAAIFEPFKQTETGLRDGNGTGLGMPISKSLAEAHGGRLWIESQRGHGSTFYLTLPFKSTVLQPTFAAETV